MISKYITMGLIMLTGVGRASSSVSTNRLEALDLYPQIAAQLVKRLPDEHISGQEVDDTISIRTWENYFRFLDSQHIYFLSKDIDRFREYQTKLDDAILAGDLSFAYEVYEVYRDRVRDRVGFVHRQLEEGFDLTRDETFLRERKDAPYARDREEWDDLWRRLLKNMYVQRLVSDTLAKEKKAARREEAAADESSGSTNAPANPAQKTTTGTNDLNSTTNRVATLPTPPTPEEFILKRYDQLLDVLENSESISVFERFMMALTTSYDPHCSYMSPASEENFDISMRLSLFGIGAMLRQEDGALKIERLLPGGPAENDKRKIRLQVGDKIIAVAQGDQEAVDIMHWPISKAVGLIRGEKGTKVVLTVIPATDPTESTTKIVDLVRDEIKLEEQAAKHKIHVIPGGGTISNKLAVIDLPSFYADLKNISSNPDDYKSCARDVGNILKDLEDENIDGVLIDLRNNGGGSLREVVTMTGFFIPQGPVVLVGEGQDIRILPDKDPSVLYKGPLVILINRLSASASEILAAALQDYGRAVIVGDSQSYGKGSVQSVHPVSKENSRMGAVKLTNSMFYRITGSSTQLKGVTADITIPSYSETLEIGESFRTHALPWRLGRRARYNKYGDLLPFVRTLEEQSLERRQNDELFVSYTQILQRMDEINNIEELSLNLETRLQIAREREALADQRAELVEDGEEENDEAPTKDIVLNEALHILSDLATLERKSRPAQVPFRLPDEE